MNPGRSFLGAAAALITAGAMLTGVSQAADWRPKPVPDSAPTDSALAGIAVDGVRTLFYADDGVLVAVTSRKKGWRAAEPITPVSGSVQRIASVVAEDGTVTVAWSEYSLGSERLRAVQRIEGRWGSPIELSLNYAVNSMSLLQHRRIAYVAASWRVRADTPDTSLGVWRVHDGASEARPNPADVERPYAVTLFSSGRFVGLAWASDPAGKAKVAFLTPAAATWGPTTQLNSGANPITGRTIAAAGGTDAADDGTTAVVTWMQNRRSEWYAMKIRGNQLAPTTDTLLIGEQGTRLEDLDAAWASQEKVAILTAVDEGFNRSSILGSVVASGAADPAAVIYDTDGSVTTSLQATGTGAVISWKRANGGEIMARTWYPKGDSWMLQRPAGLGFSYYGPAVIADVTPSVAWKDRDGDLAQLSLDLQGPRLKRARAVASGRIKVAWNAPPQMVVTDYVVQMRPRGGSWKTVDRVQSKRTSFRGIPGTTYDVRVRARAPQTASAWSAKKTVTARR
ncbi:MAG: fibronectin type III domain-containing protein [Candidatus Nanopelagicales bacterium]